MSFGFAQPVSGLIVDRLQLPDRHARYVLDFACAYADAVTVLVCGPPSGNAAMQVRAASIRERHSGVEVLSATIDGAPPPADIAPASTAAPADRIAASLGSRRPDLVFGTDAGDRLLAGRTGARFVPCFPEPALRHATEPPDAQAAFSAAPPTRVCLFGPESTGKTTLALQLAAHYGAVHVPEYVRDYLGAVGSAGTAADVPWVARGQRAAEIACAAQAGRILICDTNLATVGLWSDVLFGATPGWIHEQAARDRYALWLLTDIDVPFEPDPQRCFPEPARRAWFMAECRRTLDRLGVAPVLLRGSPADRLAHAVQAIDRVAA